MTALQNKSFIEIQNKGKATLKKAAVLLLLYPKNGETYLLLIERSAHGVHGSQIALPGGKHEAYDKNMLTTALRETYEEVGITKEQITVIKAMTKLYIAPSNYMVYPYLALSTETLNFNPCTHEVENIIEIPLRDLLNEAYLTTVTKTTSYAKHLTVPAFNIENVIIWGATAMILSELKEILKKIL